MNKLPIFTLFLGLIFITSFAILHWVLQPLFIGDQVVEGMRAFYGPFGSVDHWQKFGLPSYLALDPPQLRVYLFDITNRQQVVRDGMKPILQQVGPYVYTIEKIPEEIPSNISGTLSFKEKTVYHFSTMHSGSLSEKDQITVLNVPFLKVVKALETMPGQNSVFPRLILLSEGEETVFIRRSVRELLFEGFSQPSLEKAQKILGQQLSDTFRNGKFRFFYHGNESISKVYEVSTKLSPSQKSYNMERDYGQILTYDGEETLSYWAKTEEDHCNEISGTPDGTLFKPMRIQGPTLNFFRPEICRSVAFHFNGVVSPYDALFGYRFSLGKELLLDSSYHFENNCFCPNSGGEIESCMEQGTLSNCRDGGVQFITTLPHYLNSPAGVTFLTQVVGLRPNPEKHDSFVDVEPISGLALKSSVKLQTNYKLSPSGGHEDLKNVPNVLFPILWTEEVKSMNMIVKQGIQQNVMKPLEIMEYSKWALLGAGAICLITGLCICALRRRKKKYPIYLNTMMLSNQDSQSVRSFTVKDRKSSGSSFKRSTSADSVWSRTSNKLRTQKYAPPLKSSLSLGNRLEVFESSI